MNQYRMLIASSDPDYDRALSLWIRRKCPPMETVCLDPDRWFDETEESFASYDRILLGGSLKKIVQGPGVRIAGGFDKNNREEGNFGPELDPFRPARDVFLDLTDDPEEERRPFFGIRIVGIEMTEPDPILEKAAERIMAALARRIRVVIGADLRGASGEADAFIKREGCRNWDDFLYSAIYARFPDLLMDAPSDGSIDENGVVRFPRSPGPNPYQTLSDRELRIMYGRIRELCPADFFAAILPESGSGVYPSTLRQMDLIIVLYRDNEVSRERMRETLRRIKGETDPSKRILEVCVSDRFRDEDVPGFILHLKDEGAAGSRSGRSTEDIPEDLTWIAEFIDDGCFI